MAINFVLCVSALQSPIEYQRRESKSNSLGRSMKPPLSAAVGLRPHSSASIDRHKLPCLRSCNTSLPSLYLPSQVPTDDHSQPEVREIKHLRFAWNSSTLFFAVIHAFNQTLAEFQFSCKLINKAGFNAFQIIVYFKLYYFLMFSMHTWTVFTGSLLAFWCVVTVN